MSLLQPLQISFRFEILIKESIWFLVLLTCIYLCLEEHFPDLVAWPQRPVLSSLAKRFGSGVDSAVPGFPNLHFAEKSSGNEETLMLRFDFLNRIEATMAELCPVFLDQSFFVRASLDLLFVLFSPDKRSMLKTVEHSFPQNILSALPRNSRR